MRGRKADVGKPLAAAGDITDKGNDIYMSGDFGWVIQKDSEIWWAMRQAFSSALVKHGQDNMVRLYKERGIYNMYIRPTADVGEDVDLCAQDDLDMGNASSGNRRQARKP